MQRAASFVSVWVNLLFKWFPVQSRKRWVEHWQAMYVVYRNNRGSKILVMIFIFITFLDRVVEVGRSLQLRHDLIYIEWVTSWNSSRHIRICSYDSSVKSGKEFWRRLFLARPICLNTFHHKIISYSLITIETCEFIRWKSWFWNISRRA